MKRTLSTVLALVLCLSSVRFTVSAKTALPTISTKKPLITYTYNSSGTVKGYTSASLTKTNGKTIKCSSAECKIVEIKGDAVKLSSPVSGWFPREAFTYRDLADDAAKDSFKAEASVTTYKWKGKNTKLGSISAGDEVYLLRGDENSDWLQVIYPLDAGGYKMGWVKQADFDKLKNGPRVDENNGQAAKQNENHATEVLLSPLKGGMKVTDSSNSTNGYKCDYKASSGTAIYAPADGKVNFNQTVYKGKLISYGNWIEFTSSDDVYKVKMGHLKSFNGIKLEVPSSRSAQISATAVSGEKTNTLASRNVKKGDLLGYSGEVGNAFGPHLHVEVKKNNKAIDPVKAFQPWDLAGIALSEVNYQGTGKNGKGAGDYTKYGKFTGANGAPWCASFVSWCVKQAGVTTKIVPKTADCDTMEAESNSYYKWNKNAVKSIERNDVIFFADTSNLSDADHVGIVTDVDSTKKTITVVEGNTGSDIVKKNKYIVDPATGKITKGWSGKSFCGYISAD